MSTWNYRIVRYREDPDSFGLHEVHYDDDGQPWGMTESPTSFVCGADEGAAGIRAALRLALNDTKRLPVFDEPEVWAGSSPAPQEQTLGVES